MSDEFALPNRLKGSTPSVWNEYDALALKYKPLNLGHGFPDYAAPRQITEALAATANSSDPLLQQNTRGFGHVRLVQVLAKIYSGLVGRNLDAMSEFLVTSGAYEALYSAIMGNVDVGDEVIIIEPFFDCYEPMVRMAGGVCRFIPLRPRKADGKVSSADWVLDEAELEALFNKKTKMIIINTPHNPTGKVFKRSELEKIAELCKKYNTLCLLDEVYERLVYDNNEHVRMCTLPDMWRRTITVGSAGKTFSVTGWKIGWAYCPKELMTNLRMIHQNCVYTCPTPLQESVAIAFEHELRRINSPDCYFNSFPREMQVKRDFMVEFLTKAGFRPTIPEGGYFIIANFEDFADKIDLSTEKDKYRDFRFTKWMSKNLLLQGIPPTAFYNESHKHIGENYVRYCFIKKQENLEKAAEIFEKWTS